MDGNSLPDASVYIVVLVERLTSSERRTSSQTLSLPEAEDTSRRMPIDFNLTVRAAREEISNPKDPRLTVRSSVSRCIFFSRCLGIYLQGTRVFTAMYILSTTYRPWKRHSPIFDMESFFWILVFVPLHQGSCRKTLSVEDEDLFELLCPEKARKGSFGDKHAKMSIICHINAGLIYEESLLYPMMGLLKPLAELVSRYYAQGYHNGGEYDASDETKAIDEYIEIVETYLRSRP